MQPIVSAAAVLVSLVVAASAAAAEPLVIEIWPGKVPDENGNIGAERFRMSPALDRKQVEVTEPTRMITDVTKPTLTIYRPPKEKDSGTAMLICPGGGYWNLYWQLEGEEVAEWLNSIGVTGIILKYRVPRRSDEPQGEPARRPLQDAQRAVSLVRSRAGEWGIGRIGIVGFSAGGHLAIATATSFDKRTYEPIDDVDKISCRPDFAIPVYSGYLKAKDKDELASGLRIPSGTPPIFLAHGGDDIISPPENSVLMYLALKRAGVPAELHVYAGAAHDFGVQKRPSVLHLDGILCQLVAEPGIPPHQQEGIVILSGVRPVARGCEERAILGYGSEDGNNPNGASATSPRSARQRLPWVRMETTPTALWLMPCSRPQPRCGWGCLVDGDFVASLISFMAQPLILILSPKGERRPAVCGAFRRGVRVFGALTPSPPSGERVGVRGQAWAGNRRFLPRGPSVPSVRARSQTGLLRVRPAIDDSRNAAP